ncbi:PIN domain-containing protein [Microbacterium paludicola]|uniref:PIN domain-containing protein n=1 Tax=Microbacterium paludicola TaxID=300019 RepID=UPI0038797C5A
MYRACLDTCVLVPSSQRDFLLQLAAEGAFAPIWGTGILFELDYVLERLDRKADAGGEREHLLSEMRRAFPGATIEAPKDGQYSYDVADPNDLHVVHAAILGSADALVSRDRRAGFATSKSLADADIEVLSPEDFAAHAVAAHPRLALRAVDVIATRNRRWPQSPMAVLEQLRDAHGMVEVYEIIAPLARGDIR